MLRYMVVIVHFLLVSEAMTAEHFEIRTMDGKARIKGQVDIPKDDRASRYPAVLIVNGGWFMERDGFMGNSGTERDLIYKDLAKDLVASGIAVVRYDNRGVRCNEMTMPACPKESSEEQVSRHYFTECVDAEMRRTVSVNTQMDDVESMWGVTVNHPRIQPENILIWAHSEGGLNTGRLISSKRIRPRGVIVVGSAAESPAALVFWSMVDRYAEHLMSWDSDGDGLVTQTDLDSHYPRDPFFLAVAIKPESLSPPGIGWTLELARDHFEKIYENTKTETLAKPDDASFPDETEGFLTIAASNAWWRQWFEDTKPTIDHFTEYEGHLSFHFGEIDSQSSGPREMAFAEGRIKEGLFLKAPSLTLHKGRGHSLRTGEPAAGPMDTEAKEDLLIEIRTLLLRD